MNNIKEPKSNTMNDIVDLTHPNVVILSNILIKPAFTEENYPHKSSSTITSAAGGKTNRANQIIRQPSGYVKCTNCKKPATLQRVTKDPSKNGLFFYNCMDCDFDFFQWADESKLVSSANRTELPTQSTAFVKRSQKVCSNSTAISSNGNTNIDDNIDFETESETELDKENSIGIPKLAKGCTALKNKKRVDKRKKRKGNKKRNTTIKITKRNLKSSSFVHEATLDKCESASSLSEIELDMPFQVKTQFSTKTNTLFNGVGREEKSLRTSNQRSSSFNVQPTNDNRELIDSHKLKDHRGGGNFHQPSMLQNIDSVTESENESTLLLLPIGNLNCVRADIDNRHVTGMLQNIDSVTESENESAQLLPPIVNLNCVRADSDKFHQPSMLQNIDSVTESENESTLLLLPIGNLNCVRADIDNRHVTGMLQNIDSVTESENESTPLLLPIGNLNCVRADIDNRHVTGMLQNIDSVTESENESAQLFSIVNQNRKVAQESKFNNGNAVLESGKDCLESIPEISNVTNDNGSDAQTSTISGRVDEIHNTNESQHLESGEILWELRVLNKKNDFNAEQNKKIMKDMKKIRKGVTKMSQTVNNLKEIRKILPNKTRERFVLWDERITNDTDFYKKMYLYLRRFRGKLNKTNPYGTVLKKIMTDDVVHEYNFKGTKGKFRLENFMVIELLYEIYEPSNRDEFENNLKATIAFAKKRYHLKKFRERQ